MLLQQLPPEILAKIIEKRVLQGDISDLLEHRLTSTKFSEFITDAILSAAASGQMPSLTTGSLAIEQVFKHHGGEILKRQVLHHRSDANPFAQYLKRMVDATMPLTEGFNAKRKFEIRERSIRHICCAVTALEPDALLKYMSHGVSGSTHNSNYLQHKCIAVAGALGDTEFFLHSVSGVQNAFSTIPGFPNALEGAVATNHIDTVNAVLNYILSTVKGPRENATGTWTEMREAATGIYNALLVAIRLHHHRISDTIITALQQNKALGNSVSPESRRLFLEYCISHGNFEFYGRALDYRRNRNWEALKKKNNHLLDLDEYEVKDLLRRCSKWMLRRLIETKQFDPNYVGKNETPIFLALSVRRQSLVKVLLEAGADIDGFPRAGGGSALHRARMRDWRSDARFLKIDLGATCIANSK